MGAQNVAKVFMYWRQLDHREARALLFMANTALDKDLPPVYFGGWEALAHAIGHDPSGNKAAAKRAAMRTLSALRKSGAIVSSGQAMYDVRSEYALALDPEATFKPQGKGRNVGWVKVNRPDRVTVDVTHMGDPACHPVKTVDVTHMGDMQGTNWVTPDVTPMRTEEPQGGIQDEPHGGISPGFSIKLTSAREAKTMDGDSSSLEAERQRQMAGLKNLIEQESAS